MTPSTERADRHSTTDRLNPAEGQDDVARALTPVVAWAERVSGLPVIHDWPDAAPARTSRGWDADVPGSHASDAPDGSPTHDVGTPGTVTGSRAAMTGDAPSVVLYPFALEPVAAPATLALRARGAEVTLRVLVTATGEPHDIAAVTAALALDAALAELSVETGAVDLALWQALERRPAAAFVLAVPVRRSLDLPVAPPVRSRRLVVADPATIRGTGVDAPPAAADDLTVTAAPAAGTAPAAGATSTPAPPPGASAVPLLVPSTSTH